MLWCRLRIGGQKSLLLKAECQVGDRRLVRVLPPRITGIGCVAPYADPRLTIFVPGRNLADHPAGLALPKKEDAAVRTAEAGRALILSGDLLAVQALDAYHPCIVARSDPFGGFAPESSAARYWASLGSHSAILSAASHGYPQGSPVLRGGGCSYPEGISGRDSLHGRSSGLEFRDGTVPALGEVFDGFFSCGAVAVKSKTALSPPLAGWPVRGDHRLG
jgi:hypothetical protein